MPVNITWYDNAAFRVDTGKEILWFDPSVNKNADSPIRVEDINEAAAFVFTTHGDPGHFVNSVEVTRRTGARIVRALNVKNLFPVIQYTSEQKRIPPLKQKMETMGLKTKIFFDRPGKTHSQRISVTRGYHPNAALSLSYSQPGIEWWKTKKMEDTQ